MALYAVVAFTIFHLAGLRAGKVLVSLHAIEMGASPGIVGALVSAYSLLPLLLAIYAGKYSDRVGAGRPIMLGSLSMTLGLAAPAVFPSLWALFASAVLTGLGNIFFMVAAHNVVGSLGRADERTKNFATFGLGASIAAMVGPMMAGFMLDHFGYMASYLQAAAVGLLPALVLLAMPRLLPAATGSGHDNQDRRVFDLLREPRLRNTLFMCGVVITGVELFSFYMPIYGASIGLQASVIGIIMAMYAAAVFVVRFWLPALSRRYSDRIVLNASLALAGAAYVLFPFFENPMTLGAIAFLLGMGLGCGQPLSIALIYNQAPPGRAGEALGLRLAVNRFSQITIPAAFGSLGAVFGVAPIFWANALFLWAGGYLTGREKS